MIVTQDELNKLLEQRECNQIIGIQFKSEGIDLDEKNPCNDWALKALGDIRFKPYAGFTYFSQVEVDIKMNGTFHSIREALKDLCSEIWLRGFLEHKHTETGLCYSAKVCLKESDEKKKK